MSEYLRRLLLAQKRGLVRRGDLAHVLVAHDDYCGIYAGRDCDCDPDISVETRRGRAHVLKDGRITREH